MSKPKRVVDEPTIGLFEDAIAVSSSTRAERLFDTLISGHHLKVTHSYAKSERRPALTTVEANQSRLSDDSEPLPKNSKTNRNKRTVRFVSTVKKSPKAAKNKSKFSRDYPNCTKESLLRAFESANLPDFEEIARQELTVVQSDPNDRSRPKPPTPPLYELLKPFEDLVDWNKIKMTDSARPEMESSPNDGIALSEQNSETPTNSSRTHSTLRKVIGAHSRAEQSASLGGNQLASTPLGKRLNVALRSQNVSPIVLIESPNEIVNDSQQTARKKEVTFVEPKISQKRKTSKLKSSMPTSAVCVKLVAFGDSDSENVDINHSTPSKHKCLTSGDNAPQNESEKNSITLSDKNEKTTDSQIDSTLKNDRSAQKSVNNSILKNNSVSNSSTKELSSIFAPKFKSTPLVNAFRKYSSFNSLHNLKTSKSSASHFDLFVDKSHFDTSMSKLFSQKIRDKRYPLTTKIVPALDSRSSDDNSETISQRKKYRSTSSSSAYQIYRRSIADTQSFYCKSGLPCRTVVNTKTIDYNESRCVASGLQKTDDLKQYVDNSLSVAFSTSKVVFDNGSEELIGAKQKVMLICDPHYVIDFNKVFDQNVLNKCKKIGEGSYGEVYISKDECDNDIVIKIIPVNMVDNEDEIFTLILPELMISTTFNMLQSGASNRAPNFIQLVKSTCAKGLFLEKLIIEWDAYAKRKVSENENPRRYEESQLYIILQLSNGGVDLESYKFKNANQSLSIFIQLSFAIAAAECEYQFEHRDLHWGNVLINATNESQLTYMIDNNNYNISTNNVFVSIIDFTLSRMSNEGIIIYYDLSKYPELFEQNGDYQFDVYRKMKAHNQNDWQQFSPFTNILWLHYLLDKLINFKKYSSRSKIHKNALNMLTKFSENVLNYRSATQFVRSDQMNAAINEFCST